jgi:hypothetical protein
MKNPMDGRGFALALMKRPQHWPLRLVFALAHPARPDPWGLPGQGFLAYGHQSSHRSSIDYGD